MERPADDANERALEVEEVAAWLRSLLGSAGAGSILALPVHLQSWKKFQRCGRLRLGGFMIAAGHPDSAAGTPARHDSIVELAQQNLWLEEDGSILQMLCQLQRGVEAPEDLDATSRRIFSVLVDAINTISAPEYCGCGGGRGKMSRLFELIGAPQTDVARDSAAKFANREFAALAVVDSILPGGEAASYYDDHEVGIPWASLCYCLVLIVSTLICSAVFSRWRQHALAEAGEELDFVGSGTEL
jgi:hypothetical protein